MTRIESHSPNCYKVGGPYPCTCYNPATTSSVPSETDVEALLKKAEALLEQKAPQWLASGPSLVRELAAALREANQRAEEADARADLEYGVRCQVDNELAAARAENARLARASIDIARAAVLKILQPHD